MQMGEISRLLDAEGAICDKELLRDTSNSVKFLKPVQNFQKLEKKKVRNLVGFYLR